jgi:outer membrane protein TolC
MNALRLQVSGLCLATVGLVVGCASPPKPVGPRPVIAPTNQPSGSLTVDGSPMEPMYKQLLPVDLPAVMRVAMSRNLDIQQARQRVEAAKGRYETKVESIFPVIAPSVSGLHLGGVNQNANGTLTMANFTNFFPALTVEWIINPGQVIYDMVAAKRRLEASEHQAQAGELETARSAAVEYYDLVLAQTRVKVTRQAVEEADELLRIEQMRLKVGAGLQADVLRAQAALAAVQQDFLIALNDFYQASVALSVTLHLDATVTLVPQAGHVNQTALVNEKLSIDVLLAAAVRYRPDLAAVRDFLEAANADKGAVIWGGLGPQFQMAYTYGGLSTRVMGHTTGVHEQQRATGKAGFELGLSTFGEYKTSKANAKLAALEVESELDRVRASVVTAQQNCLTTGKLVPAAAREVESAEESLRLAQANLKAGTMLTVDVLQAQDAAEKARLHYAAAVIHFNQSQVNLAAALGLFVDVETASAAPEKSVAR